MVDALPPLFEPSRDGFPCPHRCSLRNLWVPVFLSSFALTSLLPDVSRVTTLD